MYVSDWLSLLLCGGDNNVEIDATLRNWSLHILSYNYHQELMGLFALASSGLSTYIWLVTVWDVYHPLSATINANTSAFNPVGILDMMRPSSQVPSTPNRRTKRGSIESGQREQVRDSLKAVVIWVSLCGGSMRRSASH